MSKKRRIREKEKNGGREPNLLIMDKNRWASPTC